jgi:hypothetical protein
LAKAITSVAACVVESDAAFGQRAREVAQQPGPELISTLPQFFHNPPKKPNNLIEKKWTMPIREWKRALQQFAIVFEGRRPLP